MRKLFVTCALVIAAIIIAPGSASAQAGGTVDVDIQVNGFVILYYYNDIDITIPSSVMATALAGADSFGSAHPDNVVNVTSSGSGVLTVPGSAPFSSDPGNTATLTIQNAWSVRGLTSNGVDIVVDSFSPLSGGGSGTITIPSGGCTYSGGACDNIPVTLGTPVNGDVELDLNFAGVTAPGDFQSTTAYTITATVA